MIEKLLMVSLNLDNTTYCSLHIMSTDDDDGNNGKIETYNCLFLLRAYNIFYCCC